ncbi:hypothetical protein E3N88_24742 [Mikania micrantha]|uniref:Uncharacterized protein n=1 Tax=Mikania micrantha TaxID=192012 RepID=A0A5N6N322_9ASTR|nr:hypothetical protein E3N88_24742 [Mikania micrantha]
MGLLNANGLMCGQLGSRDIKEIEKCGRFTHSRRRHLRRFAYCGDGGDAGADRDGDSENQRVMLRGTGDAENFRHAYMDCTQCIKGSRK